MCYQGVFRLSATVYNVASMLATVSATTGPITTESVIVTAAPAANSAAFHSQ
jgi:hypothetical protein